MSPPIWPQCKQKHRGYPQFFEEKLRRISDIAESNIIDLRYMDLVFR